VSCLKTKSEQNLIAAGILIERGLYAPSVHCAYYSCFQLSKYALKVFAGIDYDQQEEELNHLKLKPSTKFGSHEYVIFKLGNEINRCSKETYRIFSTNFKVLKSFRRKSDYLNEAITDEQSKESLRLSNELVQLLKSNCHL
jgi:uncharacterized protein (UPF0332 family)